MKTKQPIRIRPWFVLSCLLVVLMVVSCTQDEPVNVTEEITEDASTTNYRSCQEAIEIAENAWHEYFGNDSDWGWNGDSNGWYYHLNPQGQVTSGDPFPYTNLQYLKIK